MVSPTSNGHPRNINGVPAPDNIPEPVFNEIAKAFGELTHNYVMQRDRMFQRFMGENRNIDRECGYPEGYSPDIELYRNLYDREAIATRVVQVMPRESWQTQPSVYEDESSDVITDFEVAWDELGQNLSEDTSWHQDEQGSGVWEYLRRADELSGIGAFGVMLMGINDGRDLQLPVDGIMVMNDSPISKGEYEALEKDHSLTKNEREILTKNMWAGDLINRPYPKSTLTENRKRADPKGNYVQKSNRTRNDAWGEGAMGATSQARTSSGKRIDDLLSPTDRQYAWQGAMPPQAMSGTDQQYFGVQFGPSEETSPSPSKVKRKLLFLRAFDESLVQIVRYEWNIRNPRFGLPVMYRITLNDPREQHSGVGLPLATVFVHWSRVIHLADNRGSSEIFGIPRMRPVLNRILDLRKVYASSAEGYWQSCITGLSFSTHPQLGGDVDVNREEIKDAVNNYIQNLQRSLVGIGGEWKTLAPTIADPKGHIEILIEAVCIQLSIPIRVFKGSERGELASGQDDASWNDRVKARQHFYLTPRVVVPFVNRLIQVGVLPEPEGFSILWPDLDSNTDKDKATIAQLKTAALASYAQAQCSQFVSPKDYYTRFLGFTEEEAEEIVESATQHQSDMEDQQAASGFAPTPAPGFKDPSQPPPMPGMSGKPRQPGSKPPGAGGGKPPEGGGNDASEDNAVSGVGDE